VLRKYRKVCEVSLAGTPFYASLKIYDEYIMAAQARPRSRTTGVRTCAQTASLLSGNKMRETTLYLVSFIFTF
jgi:hypothetical protein